MDAIALDGWRGERRLRLLGAAAKVFSHRTFEQASMDEIAHEAGVGKPTLYRYFPSKDALFAAVFVEALDELERRLEAVLVREHGVRDQLHGLVATLVPTFRDHLVSLRFLGEEAAALDQSKRRIFRERKTRIARFLAEAIEAGTRHGEVRSVDPMRSAYLIVGMIWSGTSAIVADDDAIAQEITDLALSGIGGAGPTESCARPEAHRSGPHRPDLNEPGRHGTSQSPSREATPS